MNDEIKCYIVKYCDDIQNLFIILRKLIIQSVPCEVEEKMWAKLPSYYLGDKFIRIIPFKDHINIEAKAITKHDEQLNTDLRSILTLDNNELVSGEVKVVKCFRR